MGFKATVKNMFSPHTVDNTADRSVGTNGSTNTTNLYERRESNLVGNGALRQLPPDTGPGTKGKPAVASELTMQNDLERSKTGQGTSGYGTDAAAAVGGTLAGTHQGRISSPVNDRTATLNASGSGAGTVFAAGGTPGSGTTGADKSTTGGQAAPGTFARTGEFGSDARGHHRRQGSLDSTDSNLKQSGIMQGTATTPNGINSDRESTTQGLGGVGRSGILEDNHVVGHNMHGSPDSMPTGKTQDDTNHLHPIIQERVRHVEVEEIIPVKNVERHIHHIQHHTQPVTVSEELQERLRESIRPEIRVKEIHANRSEDSNLFKDQIYQHRDSLSHVEKERTIIDKEGSVNQTVHHHVHHVIQPVILKETIEKERIRTTVPIRVVKQEAPVIHQSQKHSPVVLERFLQKGGILQGGVPHDEIIRKVLHSGKCVRNVDGGAHSPGDMNVGSNNKNAQGITTALIDEDGVPSKRDAQRNTSSDQANPVSSRN